jgi:Na+-transporting methylmalonyl-CoA/oxaloacetate decarboxylase gamma subunit
MKYLIVLSLLVYVVYKVGSFFFRAGAAAQELKNFKQKQTPQANPASKKKTRVKGGEYVDYEEIK